MSRQLWGGFIKEHQFLDLVANHNVAVVIVEGGTAQVIRLFQLNLTTQMGPPPSLTGA